MTSSKASSAHSSRPHTRQQRGYKDVSRLLVTLHILNTISSLAATSILVTIIPLWNANFFHKTGIFSGDWPDGLPILPLFITLVSSTWYLVRHTRRQRANSSFDYLKSRSRQATTKPHPPKLIIYTTLTTLSLLITFLILAGISGLYRFWRPAVISSSIKLAGNGDPAGMSLSMLSLRFLTDSKLVPDGVGGLPASVPQHNKSSAPIHACTFANIFTRKCNPTLYLLGDLQIAGIATASFVWVLNLVLLVFQVRDYQYQKWRYLRSLRAKAKAKLEWVEDEMSKAEKGESGTSTKNIHHERRHRKHGHSESATHPPQTSNSSLSTSTGSSGSLPTRPARAHTNPSSTTLHPDPRQLFIVRPKQHYYNPNITPSRSRSTKQVGSSEKINSSEEFAAVSPVKALRPRTETASEPTAYSRAVEEARRKAIPGQTMRDWMGGRGL